jgi:hypothetical protein
VSTGGSSGHDNGNLCALNDAEILESSECRTLIKNSAPEYIYSLMPERHIYIMVKIRSYRRSLWMTSLDQTVTVSVIRKEL